MSEDEQLDEYDVAVVVFCRVRGVDERDAENRAEGAVSQVLRQQALMDPMYPVPGQRTKAVTVLPLSTAVNGGYLAARPSARAFKERGLDAPKTGEQA